MNIKEQALLTSFFIFLYAFAYGQVDSSWNVMLVGKGNQPKMKADMREFSSSGFYLYKNCVYDITLKSDRFIAGRLVGIKKDTLFFTNYFNLNQALLANKRLDTIAVYYKDLDQLRLIADRAMGLYNNHSFDRFDFVFKKDTTNYFFKSRWAFIYNNDPEKYELVAHMTAQGINTLYESDGRTYFFFGGGMMKPDRSLMDDTYDKRYVMWLTPCKVEEINGIALGLHSKNEKNREYNERDSLVVRGLSLEINPFQLFTLLRPQLQGPYADSIRIYREHIENDWQVKVYGVHVSAITTINELRVKGLNVTGAITTVDEIHGVTISGLTNFSYIMNGLSIAGVRNRATRARGVQIGLYNKANDLRGIQIGLWNVNGRRSLPILNWQFRGRKSR